MENYYLYVEGADFGFKHKEISDIKENDVAISDEIYNKFFRNLEKGKQYRIKNISGKTFEEIFEEIL